MNFFERLSTGWTITKNSFAILQKNKQLIIFPILSGASLILVMGTFIVGVLAASGWQADYIGTNSRVVNYAIMFGFYFVNYFIIVFFNMALIHCTKLFFDGEEVSVSIGLKFSISRIGYIVSWAIFAATIGTILKIIQENTGTLGKIITGLIGIVFSVATFFVVPIIAYENLGPIDAFKRSTQLMKQKWGESLSASFSMGLIQTLVYLLIIIPFAIIAMYINILLGAGLAIMAAFIVFAVFSAAQTIFVSSVYHNVTGTIDDHFNQQIIDSLFIQKN